MQINRVVPQMKKKGIVVCKTNIGLWKREL